MSGGPVSHAESALIAELARTRIGTQAVAARVGRSRKTVWRHRGIKPRAGALSPMARIELVRLAGLGIDHGVLARRFGLASKRSVAVIVCRERAQLGLPAPSKAERRAQAGALQEALRPPPRSSLWTTPGLSDRAAALWARHRLDKPEIAQILTAEFGIPIGSEQVRGRIERLGLAGREGGAPSVTITLAGGYVYRDRTLLRAIDAAGGRKATSPHHGDDRADNPF